MTHISRPRLMLASYILAMLLADHAHASQGPGTAPGTAGTFTQMAMAIAVYGLCAAAIAAGAIGTFRKKMRL